MKKFFSLKALLVVLTTMFAANLWAGEVTFTFKTDKTAITYTKEGTSGTGSEMIVSKSDVTLTSALAYTASGKTLSVYAKGSLTITAPGAITGVDLVYNKQCYPFSEAVGDDATDTKGKYTDKTEHAASYAPTTPATSVTLTNIYGGKTEVLSIKVTYSDEVPVAFTANDGINVINSKFTTQKLYVTVPDATGLTFTVNGAAVTYGNNGITITEKTGAKTNDTYTVQALKDDKVVAEATYTYIPTISGVSAYKQLADDTEAIFKMVNQKVTYVDSKGNAYIEDASRAIYAYGLGIDWTAGTTVNGTVWGKKSTYNGSVEIVKVDSTASCSTVTASTTAVNPTALTVAKTLVADNYLRYVKVAGAKIVLEGKNYYAYYGDDKIQVYDQFKNGVLTSLETTPIYADIICIVGIYKSTPQLYPISLENVADELTGVSGGVSWKIDLDGNMTFYPTNGVSGVLAKTGIAASTRSWDAVKDQVKTVKFEEGVQANTEIGYMFYNMTKLESVDFTNFNVTVNTVKAKGLFQNCASLKAADLSALDLTGVTDMSQMFNGCTALESVNFGDNNAANVTTMNSMFLSCSSLEALDLSNFAPVALQDIANMLYGCSALKSLDIRGISTANVTKASKAKSFIDANSVPETLVINKEFGKLGDGSYVALPFSIKYQPLEATGLVVSKVFDMPADQAALYAYNEVLPEYGTYVKFGTIPATEVAYTTNPENGSTVASLKMVTYRFVNNIYAFPNNYSGGVTMNDYPTITNDKGENVATNMECLWGNDFEPGNLNLIDLKFDEITEPGLYIVTIPVRALTLDGYESTEAYSVAITVDPSAAGSDATAINNVNAAETTVKAGKFIENGKVVIYKNGKKYNAAGAQLK